MGELLRFQLKGEAYAVSVETFAGVSEEFYLAYRRARDAQQRGDVPAWSSALQWMFWGVLGLVRDANPNMPPELPLTESQIVALSDMLYEAAVERGLIRPS
jgi:hypothetical protein